MKNTDLKSKTSEELKAELRGIKIVSWALIGVLTPLFIITIYGLITDKNAANISLLAVAVSCSAILPMQFISIKQIKSELKSRNGNN